MAFGPLLLNNKLFDRLTIKRCTNVLFAVTASVVCAGRTVLLDGLSQHERTGRRTAARADDIGVPASVRPDNLLCRRRHRPRPGVVVLLADCAAGRRRTHPGVHRRHALHADQERRLSLRR